MFHTDVYRGIQILSGEYGNGENGTTSPIYNPSLRGDTLPPQQTVGYRGCTWCSSIRQVSQMEAFRGENLIDHLEIIFGSDLFDFKASIRLSFIRLL